MRTIADINLESALYELRPACRVVSDRLDEVTPYSRASDTEVIRWLANTIEVLTLEAERNGAEPGIADTAKRLADATERLNTLTSIRKAWRACDAVERRVKAALAAYGLPDPL